MGQKEKLIAKLKTTPKTSHSMMQKHYWNISLSINRTKGKQVDHV